MSQEILDEPIWRKSISPSRNRMQSLTLATSIGTLLTSLAACTLFQSMGRTASNGPRAAESLAISAVFAGTVWSLRAATPAAAAFGGIICLLITYWTASTSGSVFQSALTPLATLFLITFLATRAGRQRKAAAGIAEPQTGRTASQVIANLSVAALCATPIVVFSVSRWVSSHTIAELVSARVSIAAKSMCLAVLVEATADTVSSEIGQAFGGIPYLLPTFRNVEPGTDGAITLIGTEAGTAAAATIALVGLWSLQLDPRYAFYAMIAGIAGLFFDSFLGATVEQKGWIGNDLVNFASTAFAAAIAAVLCLYWH